MITVHLRERRTKVWQKVEVRWVDIEVKVNRFQRAEGASC